MYLRKVGCILFILSLFLNVVSAQQSKGIIIGKAITNDGKLAASVSIKLTGSIIRNTITDKEGSFSLSQVPSGEYTITASLIGFKNVVQHVTVKDGQSTIVSIPLELSSNQLSEVIVKSKKDGFYSNGISSSLRLNEPIMEAPQNIQIVTGEALSFQQIISMSDGVLRNVSGAVRLEHWGDLYTNVTMRGSQVQAFRNGFNVVNSYWGPLTEDMSMVDHIEFVKGPAGFMLANGDPSGLYNVVTKKPTGETKGSFSLTSGSFDLYRATLDLDGKISKDGKLLYRLNVAGQNKGSFRANEFNNRYTVAPVLSYQIDDKTKLTLEYTYQLAKMSDLGSYYVFSPKGYATLPRNTTFLPQGIAPTTINDHSIFINFQHQLTDSWKVTAQTAYLTTIGLGSDMWPSAVNKDGTINRSIGIWDSKSKMTLAQVFLNGNAKTGDINHRILLGLDMGNKKYLADWGQSHLLDSIGGAYDPLNPYYGVPNNGYPSFDRSQNLEARAVAAGGIQNQNYTGVYVQDELGFFDNKLRFTLAGRYTQVSQVYGTGLPDKANHFTPRIGLSYSIDKSFSVYALYDQAFTPQSGTLVDGGKVKPITGNNQEIGLKKEWADGKWMTSLAFYKILKNNELTSAPNANPLLNLSVVLGQKRARGIEFDLKGNIAKGVDLTANYAFTESEVTKVANGVTDIKVGDVIPGFSKHVANLWLNYQLQEGVLKGAGISAGATYMGDRAMSNWSTGLNASDKSKNLPNYFKMDGGVFWGNKKIRLTLNVFNLLDKYLYSGGYYEWLSAYYWQAEAPRNFRLSVSYAF